MCAARFSLLGRILLASLVAGTAFGVHASPRTETEPRVTGTYSDMHYIQQSGDVLGTELKIVFTGSMFQGALQIAQGPPGELIMVNVESKDLIQFTMPDDCEYPGNFSGTVSKGWLRGKFQYKNGFTETVALRRGKSYWD